MIISELLHLKMEVTVSEPCDVIRVGFGHDHISKTNEFEPMLE